MTNQQLAHRSTLPDTLRQQRDFILLDGSGSMQDSWWPMMEAIEAYISELKRNRTETYTTLTVFSGNELEMVQRDCTLDQWQSLLTDPATSTWEHTPLYDAINAMSWRLRDEDPIRCSITIVTDGDEYGSRFTSLPQAKGIIEWFKAKGWQVTFIGCDWDNERLARSLGVHPSAAIGVSKALLPDAAKELAKKRSAHAVTGAPMHWDEEERHRFGGYLGHSGSGS